MGSCEAGVAKQQHEHEPEWTTTIMTDNGPCLYADLFRDDCRQLQHLRTRIYTPLREPTVRPSASSRPLSANRPMRGSIRTLAE